VPGHRHPCDVSASFIRLRRVTPASDSLVRGGPDHIPLIRPSDRVAARSNERVHLSKQPTKTAARRSPIARRRSRSVENNGGEGRPTSGNFPSRARRHNPECLCRATSLPSHRRPRTNEARENRIRAAHQIQGSGGRVIVPRCIRAAVVLDDRAVSERGASLQPADTFFDPGSWQLLFSFFTHLRPGPSLEVSQSPACPSRPSFPRIVHSKPGVVRDRPNPSSFVPTFFPRRRG